MRKHLCETSPPFTTLILHGNVRQNPKLSGTTHNVFGIQVGVGITIAVRKRRHKRRTSFRITECRKKLREGEKLAWLGTASREFRRTSWANLTPTDGVLDCYRSMLTSLHVIRHSAIKSVEGRENGIATHDLSRYTPSASRPTVTQSYMTFQSEMLATGSRRSLRHYNAEVDRYKRTSSGERRRIRRRYTNVNWDRDSEEGS